MRKLLLAGLVGFALVGSAGVSSASAAAPDPDGELWTTVVSPVPDANEKSKNVPVADEEQEPIVGAEPGCYLKFAPGVGAGQIPVEVTNPNEQPADGITYTLTLLRGSAVVETKDLLVKHGKDTGGEDIVGTHTFPDVASGNYTVKVAHGQLEDLTEEFYVDRCKEITTPIKGKELQVVHRCKDGVGVVTPRFFPWTEEAAEYEFSITDSSGDEGFAIPTNEWSSEDLDYLHRNEIPMHDDTWKFVVTRIGDPKEKREVTVPIACGTKPPTNPGPAAPAANPVKPVANTGGLADTGASVGWLTAAGVVVLGFGAGLVVLARRRRTQTSN